MTPVLLTPIPICSVSGALFKSGSNDSSRKELFLFVLFHVLFCQKDRSALCRHAPLLSADSSAHKFRAFRSLLSPFIPFGIKEDFFECPALFICSDLDTECIERGIFVSKVFCLGFLHLWIVDVEVDLKQMYGFPWTLCVSF